MAKKSKAPKETFVVTLDTPEEKEMDAFYQTCKAFMEKRGANYLVVTDNQEDGSGITLQHRYHDDDVDEVQGDHSAIGPFCIGYANGAVFGIHYAKDGSPHREDGPAIRTTLENPKYYIEGKRSTPEQVEYYKAHGKERAELKQKLDALEAQKAEIEAKMKALSK